MVSSNRSRVTSLLAVLCALFLLATACSDDGGDEASSETTEAPAEDGATTTTAAPDAEPPSETAAADLLSDLTGLLEEQVYLTGYVVQQATAGGGLDSPVASAAVDEAGESATELSEEIGAAYGVAAGNEFLAAWNDHRDAIVAYAVDGGPEEDVATTRQAVLDALAEIDAQAAFTDIGESLEASDTQLLTAVDGIVAGDQAAGEDLRGAADEMPAAAVDLADAIAGTVTVEGDLTAPEVALRAELTRLMQESVLLTGMGLADLVATGGDSSPASAGYFDAVAANTTDLAGAVEPDDDAAASAFADLWSEHIQYFQDYALALVNDDAQGIEDAQNALVVFRDDLGAVLEADYPAFTQEQVAEELVHHTDSVLAYTDALVREAGDLAEGVEETSEIEDAPSDAPALLREAALDARLAARTLTRGLTTTAPPE